jgi:DNA-K related protein/Hsp70 protein
LEGPSRYLIGIDLGTTNCAVSFIDTDEPLNGSSPRIHDFAVAQLTAPGEVRSEPILPSFLYFPTEQEVSSGLVNLPWEEHPLAIAGIMARDHGALTPGRQVASAKSWLSQDAVNRRDNILPRAAEPPEPMVSPIEASARYLAHLRNAWNHEMAGENSDDSQQLFENQEIVLTVPASFDEEARELTVEAARQAGLKKLTLLEEPLAAFYAWVAEHQETLGEHLRDREIVLICDIGGGTSDFSLIRSHVQDGKVEFERIAIGEHLLLGGENLDLALARGVEENVGIKLSLRQSHALRVTCSAVKERLLNDRNLDRLPINILGGGRAVLGQMISSELSRDEVNELLINGFLPLTASDEMPVRTRGSGLREIGLQYVTDPAITKHLAAFLKNAAAAMARETETQTRDDNKTLARPDAILFNGGFCIPAIVRHRITEAIANWFGDSRNWRPKILNHEVLSSAVAIGATYYGRVRHGGGLRVKAGSARTFYVGVRSEHGIKAVCLLPAGTNEGTTLPLPSREFSVLANTPVSFRLYSSTVRHDVHGAIAELNPEQVRRHAPLVTLLRYGKRFEQTELAVRLSMSFTEVGTLELWCESVNSPHRWRLQFELRGEASGTDHGESMSQSTLTSSRHAGSVSEPTLDSAVQFIHSTFKRPAGPKSDAVDPASLAGQLESVIGLRRESWTLPTVRVLCDALLEVADGRRLSPPHEVRWLNLFGYCLRPGFGDGNDNLRTAQARRIYQAGLSFPRELQCQVDWLVLWRRIAGGLGAVHQQKLWNYLGEVGIGRKKPRTRLNSQIDHEGWRLLASLEHLPASGRAALGDELVRKLKKEPSDGSWLWSLGRVGARIPLYGSLNCVVPAERAADWIRTLLEMRELVPETSFAIVQLGRRVEDRSRDVNPQIIESAIVKLKAAAVADEDLLRPLMEFTPPVAQDVARTFGEPLPRGLELESTPSCLSPVTALAS